jgi:hypothetical protein
MSNSFEELLSRVPNSIFRRKLSGLMSVHTSSI